MGTFYFSIVAIKHNPRIEVRRVLAVKANSVKEAELQILLNNQCLWNDGWSLQMLQICEHHYETLLSCLELEEVPA